MSIDEYLDDLYHRLHVDSLRRDEIRLEVHTHLRHRADALVREGMNQEAAEVRAVEEFGEAAETADRLSSVPSTPVRWDYSRHFDILSGLLIAGGVTSIVSFVSWASHTLRLGPYLSLSQFLFIITGGIGYNALKLVFGFYLYRRAKWVRLPLLIICSIIPVCYTYFTMRMTLLPGKLDRGSEVLLANLLPLFLCSFYVLWVLVPRRSLKALR